MKNIKKFISFSLAFFIAFTSICFSNTKVKAATTLNETFLIKNSANIPNVESIEWGNEFDVNKNYPLDGTYKNTDWNAAFDDDTKTKVAIVTGGGHNEGDYVILNFENSFTLKELKIISNGKNYLENYTITASSNKKDFNIPVTSRVDNTSIQIMQKNLNVEINAIKIRVDKDASHDCWLEFNEICFNYNDSVNMTYFPSTMYKYDGSKMNADTQELTFDDVSNGIYFAYALNADAENLWNKWTTARDKIAYTGLVNSSLINGQIKFTKPEAGIFDNTAESKSIYHNVGIPFKVEPNGYYEFDSSKFDANFANGKPADNVNLVYDLDKNEYIKSDNSRTQGFYPYNSVSNEPAQYHFGMNLGVDFYLPSNGKDEKTGEPIIFEFSGDDDVWVFVDGKLVLDIGGIHGAIKGTINFATGEAYNQGLESNQTYDIYTNDYLGRNFLKNENQRHTLQVFYMERGKGESNCRIRFNLPQKRALEVSKTLAFTNYMTQYEREQLFAKDFTFKLYKSDVEGTTSGLPVGAISFTLYQGTSQIGTRTTNPDGTFTLKHDQKAVFDEGVLDSNAAYYYVKEQELSIEDFPDGTKGFYSQWDSGVLGNETIHNEGYVSESIHLPATSTNSIPTVQFKCTNYIIPGENAVVDDRVVLDYGKQVIIDVLNNDTVYGTPVIDVNYKENNGTPNGKISILERTNERPVVLYRPYKYMDTIDVAEYTLQKYADAATETKGTLEIIPATTVYYEDNFGGTGENGEPGLSIKYSGNWSEVSEGSADNQQDEGNVGEGNGSYGQDSSYTDDSSLSNGSSHVIDGTTKKDENGNTIYEATASFEFKGTGFDLISRTDPECGMITAQIQMKDKDTGEWGKATPISVLNKGENTLYQIPVITYKGNEYGEYKVTIQVRAANSILGYKSKFYLDAIRIYNPMGLSNSDNKDFDNANDAYEEDGEANSQVISLRDKLITESTDGIGIEINSGYRDGVVWIDSLGEINDNTDNDTISLETYKTIGPNREIYLNGDCAIAFELIVDQIPISVQIGAKAPMKDAVSLIASSTESYTVSGAEIETATDMYYDITDGIKWIEEDGKYKAILYIANGTDQGILSLTNLKLTYEEKTTEPLIQTNVNVVRRVLACLNGEKEEYEADYEITEATFEESNVYVDHEATILVKTSKDVEYLTLFDDKGRIVEPVAVESSLNENLISTEANGYAKTWRITVVPTKTGKLKYALLGTSLDNHISEKVVKISAKVTKMKPKKGSFKPWN